MVPLDRPSGTAGAMAAAQALGFGAAGLVIFSQAGGEGLGTFLLLGLGSLVLTAVFRLRSPPGLPPLHPWPRRRRPPARRLAVALDDRAAASGSAAAGQERGGSEAEGVAVKTPRRRRSRRPARAPAPWPVRAPGGRPAVWWCAHDV